MINLVIISNVYSFLYLSISLISLHFCSSTSLCFRRYKSSSYFLFKEFITEKNPYSFKDLYLYNKFAKSTLQINFILFLCSPKI